MRKQSKQLVSIMITCLLLLTVVQAQSIDFQLGGKTNAESFEIKDSDGKVIFQLKGNGKIGLGSAVLASTKMHVQGGINAQGVYKIQGKTVLSKKGLANTFVGEDAGKVNTGSYNTFIGHQAGYNNGSGTYNNNFIGYQAGYTNTTGVFNNYIGRRAGHSSTGSRNNFFGDHVGQNNTGTDNVFIGDLVGRYSSTGSNNVYIGAQAGENSTGLGNVFLGYHAGENETGSNLLYIENSNSSSPLIWGDFANNRLVINGNSSDNTNSRTFFSNGAAGGTGAWNNDSDVRMKKNIATINQALDKVQSLRGVNFEWKETVHHEDGLQMGFIAQEVEEVIPEVVSNGGDSYSMQYSPLTALLVEAVKEQQQIINDLKQRVQTLENQQQLAEVR
jgi:hypothetical protein